MEGIASLLLGLHTMEGAPWGYKREGFGYSRTMYDYQAISLSYDSFVLVVVERRCPLLIKRRLG